MVIWQKTATTLQEVGMAVAKTLPADLIGEHSLLVNQDAGWTRPESLDEVHLDHAKNEAITILSS